MSWMSMPAQLAKKKKLRRRFVVCEPLQGLPCLLHEVVLLGKEVVAGKPDRD